MSELTKLETLEKAVVDTEAAYYNDDAAWDAAALVAYAKARDELEDYRNYNN